MQAAICHVLDLYLLRDMMLIFLFVCRDNERKRKVRELLGQLAQQEGECKAFKKPKRADS